MGLLLTVLLGKAVSLPLIRGRRGEVEAMEKTRARRWTEGRLRVGADGLHSALLVEVLSYLRLWECQGCRSVSRPNITHFLALRRNKFLDILTFSSSPSSSACIIPLQNTGFPKRIHSFLPCASSCQLRCKSSTNYNFITPPTVR